MKKHVNIKKFVLFSTLLIVTIAVTLCCVIAYTLHLNKNDADNNVLTVSEQYAKQSNQTDKSIKLSPMLAVAAGSETGIVIGVLGGILGAIALGVGIVAVVSAKQSKDIAKNKDKKQEDISKLNETVKESVIESDGFDDDTATEPVEESEEISIKDEEENIDEVIEDTIEEPISEVVEEPIEELVEEEIAAEVIEEEPIIVSAAAEEEDNDDEDNEEIITVTHGGRVVKIRLLRSFTAKVIQGNELLQDSYSDLKNHAMGYKGVKARISFPYDSLNKGRQQLIKFVIRGKHLCLYCALDPTEVPDTWHTEISESKRYQNVPVFIRIKGSTTLSRALKMIDMVCNKYELKYNADESVDYHMPYEPNEPLIERSLIKVYADGDVDGAELITAGYREKLSKSEVISEPPIVEETQVEEELEVEPEEDNLDADGEENEVIVINDGDREVHIRMVRSFTAKLIQANELVQNSYSVLKNQALGFDKAKARISFPYDSINYGKQQLVKFVIRGKSLFVYCAIKFDDITESWHSEITKYKRYQNVPVYIKIKGNTTLEIAKRMINHTCRSFELKFIQEQNVDYTMPYENNAPLIDRKLIKIYSDSELDTALMIKAKYGNSLSKVSAAEVGSMMSDVDAQEIVKKSVEITPIENAAVHVAAVKNLKKGIVNIDTLSKHFNNGETIDIKALADKKLIEPNVTAIKVLARGSLDKRFIVKANDFSLDAVKMITLLGGKVLVVK